MSRLILRSLPRTLTLTLPFTLPSRIIPPPRPYTSSTFDPGPSPPRLPAAQQAEFERLQREAAARLHSHTTSPSPPLQTSRHATSPSPASSQPEEEETVSEATFSGGIRKGAPPEFEGDRNPVTGEVGGPKNEPLRWGGGGDWSYNGRVTDF